MGYNKLSLKLSFEILSEINIFLKFRVNCLPNECMFKCPAPTSCRQAQGQFATSFPGPFPWLGGGKRLWEPGCPICRQCDCYILTCLLTGRFHPGTCWEKRSLNLFLIGIRNTYQFDSMKKIFFRNFSCCYLASLVSDKFWQIGSLCSPV